MEKLQIKPPEQIGKKQEFLNKIKKLTNSPRAYGKNKQKAKSRRLSDAAAARQERRRAQKRLGAYEARQSDAA